MKNDNSVPLKKIAPIIGRARKAAVEYQKLTGKPLGVCGEIGEYEAARLLGLKLADARSPGHDAIDRKGRKIEIKTRRTPGGKTGIGRIGVTRLKHPWDALLLVILDDDFKPTVIFEASRASIAREIKKPGSRARNERGQLAISQVKRISRVVWKA